MNFDESDIIRYLKGDVKGQEETDFLKSIKNDTALREEYYRLKDVWDFSGMKLQSIPYDQNQEWKKLRSKLYFNSRHLRIGPWLRVASVAAAIIVAFFIGQQPFFLFDKGTKTMVHHTFVAPEGQISQVLLADGTNVTLNAGSKLLVPLDFGEQERSLELEGEGFFDVTKDPRKAFVVHSGSQQVKVLGTRFNIRAYPDETLFETTLEEGSIEWSCNQHQLILKPGMQVIYDQSTEKMVRQVADVSGVKVWSLGRYEYQNAPFSRLVSVIEKWHDVTVIYNESDFTGKHFNGTIKKSASLDRTLQIIGLMIPIKYSIINDTIKIETIK
ncbi:MAG: FecR domain-containing protein [Marinilabiliaceae bacterium]|nr:FecR domain-containing protein [Marinilabiliaceae bacterium]